MELSYRQQAIKQTWMQEDTNILVKAVAGSGKTTLLMEILDVCEYRTLFLAFNKSIQEEIQEKITKRGFQQGKALTLHSLGLQAVNGKYSKTFIKSGKNFELIKQLQNLDKYKTFFRRMSWEDKLSLSYSLMDMNDISRLFLTDDRLEIGSHFSSMDKVMSTHPRLNELWEDLIILRNKTYEGNSIDIDFIDMIYIPVIQELYIPVRPYYLMIDEAQDLNLCQHRLIDRLINQGDVKKWIAVGDSNQSIYGFSGAYSSSFDIFLQKGNVVQLPLDICYRCSNTILSCANEVYNVMESSTEEEGLVEDIYDASEVKQGSMIICRNSSPLISLYFYLLGKGKPCILKGDDILGSVLRFLKPYNNYTVHSAKIEMMYKLEELLKDNSDEGRLEHYIFSENFENFRNISLNLAKDMDSIHLLVERVKALFEDSKKENPIILCTIHKSKGLEAEVVYIVNENLIPSKFAKSPEQLKQEKNLKYVARTRAKKELYFLNI